MGTWECSEGKGEGKGQAKIDLGALLSGNGNRRAAS